MENLLITFIYISTVVVTQSLSAATTNVAWLVPDEGFSGFGDGYHLLTLDRRGANWSYVVSDDFWLHGEDDDDDDEEEPEVTSGAVCHVMCREKGDYNAGTTYTIPEDGGGMVRFRCIDRKK